MHCDFHIQEQTMLVDFLFIYFYFLCDDAFSIEIRLELAGIVGQVDCFWMLGSSTEIRNKGSTGVCSLPLRCLSQFFPVEEKIN